MKLQQIDTSNRKQDVPVIGIYFIPMMDYILIVVILKVMKTCAFWYHNLHESSCIH